MIRTIETLLTEANATESTAEAERDLFQAVDQVSSLHDWEKILRGIPAAVSIARRHEIVARALHFARTREDVWTFRHVAVFQAHDLGEREAARETLREAERMLLAMSAQDRAEAFYFGVLAIAHRLALQSDDEAIRLLNAGWTLGWRKRDVENLGRLANHWRALDPAEAIARLRLVEEAAAGWENLGGVIYWWHALGDAAAGDRVRQTVLETTRRFSEAHDLAGYWHLYDKNSPGVEAALDRAEALASSAAEFLALAQSCVSGENSEARRRRVLDHAAAIANTTEIRARIATAYVDWFHDQAAADRVGPRGVRPEHLALRLGALEGWTSSPSDLFDWLRPRMTAEQLTVIAKSDYGMDEKEHFAALDSICKSGLLPFELGWEPLEVCCLTRWSRGDEVDHFNRALCCVLLSLAASDNELISTGPPLIESCLALGEDASLCCERLLVWKYETVEADSGERLVTLVLLFMLRV
ncbi:MAG: hypothetical protein ABI461_21530, partial [Polyangiaceae bacterium]